VRETLKRADVAGLAWPLPEDMTDAALETALYASRRSKRGHRRIVEPDWASVHRELKRKHVTLLILWDEYIAADPGGYSYSRFCELYRAFEKTLSVTMRQTHAAGERLFVDYAGDGVPVIIDRLTGEIRMAQIFVAVLGASSFTFAKATPTQARKVSIANPEGSGGLSGSGRPAIAFARRLWIFAFWPSAASWDSRATVFSTVNLIFVKAFLSSDAKCNTPADLISARLFKTLTAR